MSMYVIYRKDKESLPARKLKDPNPFGLRIIRTTKHSKYSTHCDILLVI